MTGLRTVLQARRRRHPAEVLGHALVSVPYPERREGASSSGSSCVNRVSAAQGNVWGVIRKNTPRKGRRKRRKVKCTVSSRPPGPWFKDRTGEADL